MVAQQGAGGGRQAYRPVLPRILILLLAAFGLWWDVDLLLRGRPVDALVALLWMVAVLAALAAVFWRPAVVVDAEGVELRNVLRDVRVPWALLEGVEERFALTLVAGGRRHQSWSAASGGRPPRRHPSDLLAGPRADRTSRARPRADAKATAAVVEARWLAWQEAEQVRARLAARSAAAEPPSGDPAGPGPAPPTGGQAPGPVVDVRSRPQLLVVALGAAVLAAVLTLLG